MLQNNMEELILFLLKTCVNHRTRSAGIYKLLPVFFLFFFFLTDMVMGNCLLFFLII